MTRKIVRLLTALLIAVTTTVLVWAQSPDPCQPTPVKLGPMNPKNGFPLWVEDSRGIRTELCLDPGGVCFLDPVDPANPYSVQVGFGPEAFWFLAGMTIAYPANASSVDGNITLGVEAAWAAENPNPGDQFPFIRFRYRFDVLPEMGTYTLEHPWGKEVFDTVWIHDVDPDKAGIDRIFVTHDAQFAAGAFTKGKFGPFPVPANPGSPHLGPANPGTFTLPAGFNQAANPGCSRTTFRLTGTRLCVDSNADGFADGRGNMLMATCNTSIQGQPIDFDPSPAVVRTFVEEGAFNISSGKVATRVGVDHFQSAYINTGSLKGVEVFARAISKTGDPDSNLVAVVEGTSTEYPMNTSVDSKGRYFAFIPAAGLAGFATTAADQVTVINKSDPVENFLNSALFQSRATRTMTDVVDIRTTYWWSSGANVNKLELVARTTNTFLNPNCPAGAWAGITTGGSSLARLKAFHMDGEFLTDLTTSTTNGWSVFHPTTNPPHKVVIRSCFGGRSEADVEIGIPVAR